MSEIHFKTIWWNGLDEKIVHEKMRLDIRSVRLYTTTLLMYA